MSEPKANNFLESLEHTHVVLFHEGGKETKNAEYNFIKNGLNFILLIYWIVILLGTFLMLN